VKLKELSRRQNPDAAKRVEGKQVIVTRNDQISIAIRRQFEKFIVTRIAANLNARLDQNEPRCHAKRRNEFLPPVGRQNLGELLPAQDRIDLRENRSRQEKEIFLRG
jgi:hypothetical protein